MSATKDIHVLQQQSAPRRISRRELAQTLLSGLAAGFVSPASFASHPIHKHLLNGTLLDAADAHLSADSSKPLFFSAQQLAALDALSEAIVPGSRQAQGASFIDLLLSAETPEVQHKFLVSLSALEAISQNTHHAEIIVLSLTQLHGLLTSLSAPNSSEYRHFIHLKDWIAGAYYSSETGMRELGWTPDRVFATFPACPHPEGHA
jgi:Gluconate 2-dehydrogenase subunit 3